MQYLSFSNLYKNDRILFLMYIIDLMIFQTINVLGRIQNHWQCEDFLASIRRIVTPNCRCVRTSGQRATRSRATTSSAANCIASKRRAPSTPSPTSMPGAGHTQKFSGNCATLTLSEAIFFIYKKDRSGGIYVSSHSFSQKKSAVDRPFGSFLWMGPDPENFGTFFGLENVKILG
jgi:hypothetical protein